VREAKTLKKDVRAPTATLRCDITHILKVSIFIFDAKKTTESGLRKLVCLKSHAIVNRGLHTNHPEIQNRTNIVVSYAFPDPTRCGNNNLCACGIGKLFARKSASSGTINVPRVFSATNKIIQYFKSIPLEIRDIELTTPEADWFIVSSYPPSGVGRVEAFCFLKDVVGWELRLAIVLPSAPSMLLECRFNEKTHVLEVFSGGASGSIRE